MPTNRVVFIPFRADQATDFVAETQRSDNDSRTHHSRRFTAVCYDEDHGVIRRLGNSLGTRVLIAGHGRAGRPTISNTTGVGEKEYLPYNVVVDRLIEHGLSKWYTGTICCDNCWSAVPQGGPAFADLVARYLRKKGYYLAHTMGFMGPLGAVPEEMGGHSYYHRVVDIYQDNDDTKPMLATVKSKDAMKRFFGFGSLPD